MKKKCSTCLRIKKIDSFNRRGDKKDGRSNMCRICGRKAAYERYHKTPEYLEKRERRMQDRRLTVKGAKRQISKSDYYPFDLIKHKKFCSLVAEGFDKRFILDTMNIPSSLYNRHKAIYNRYLEQKDIEKIGAARLALVEPKEC